MFYTGAPASAAIESAPQSDMCPPPPPDTGEPKSAYRRASVPVAWGIVEILLARETAARVGYIRVSDEKRGGGVA